jgi:ABC-type transport system involved in Fe-S cluster assembly fused permease/ATPase subunit
VPGCCLGFAGEQQLTVLCLVAAWGLQENDVSSKAVDALLNYETVTLFNNSAVEVAQYDTNLLQYRDAAVWSEQLQAVLNAGQAVILALGLTGVLMSVVLAAKGGAAVSPGDIIMVQGLMLQLWAPLQVCPPFSSCSLLLAGCVNMCENC